MRRKGKILVSATLIMSMVLSGCKENHEQEYLDQYNNALAEYQTLYDQYRDLKDIVSVYTGETDSDYVYKIKESDGTVTKYHSYDGTIMVSNDLVLPGVTSELENQATVELFQDVVITPSDKWLVRPSTSKTTMVYDDGIYGELEVMQFYPNDVNWEVYYSYDEVIKPYFDTLGITDVADGVVYYSGNISGRYGVGTINTVTNSTELKTDDEIWGEVKEKITAEKLKGNEVNVDINGGIPSNLKELASQYNVNTVKSGDTDGKSILWVGLVKVGNILIKFRFTYKDNELSTSFNEVIKNLMGTLKVYGNAVSMN